MTPAEAGSTILQVAIVVIMALAILLSLLPKECQCEKCSFHVNERRMAREAERVKRHRQIHATFRLPWPYASCGECKAGHSDDQPTERNP